MTEQLRSGVALAVESFQDEPDDHFPPPTPSTVMHCLLQQWLVAKGYPKLNRRNAASLKRLEAGHVIEGFWRGAFERMGFHVDALPIVSFERDLNPTEMDAILYPETSEAAALVDYSIGKPVVLELKDLGVWGYFDFVEKGAALGAENYYVQTQLKMEAVNTERAVLLAGMADPSAARWIWERIKKRVDPLPPLWAELLYPDADALAKAHGRAQTLNHFKDRDTPPEELREFEPELMLPGRKFPCYYCDFAPCTVLMDKRKEEVT